MDVYFTLVGKIVVWTSTIIVTLLLIGFAIKFIINTIGRFFKSSWLFIEFLIYKKDYLQWVKDKERHAKLK